MQKTTLNRRTHIGVNTATDTPVLFEVGNSLIAWQVNPFLAIINLIFAVFVGYVRVASEKVKFSKEKGKAKDKTAFKNMIDSFVGNIGASLEASGIVLIGIGAIGLGLYMFSTSELLPALIICGFGIANFSRGFAMRLKKESVSFNALNLIGIIFAAVSCAAVAPASPLLVKAIFVLAVIAEFAQSSFGKLKVGMADLIFSFALFVNVFFSADLLGVFANLLFCIAFISLSMTKTSGGVVEYFMRNKAKL